MRTRARAGPASGPGGTRGARGAALRRARGGEACARGVARVAQEDVLLRASGCARRVRCARGVATRASVPQGGWRAWRMGRRQVDKTARAGLFWADTFSSLGRAPLLADLATGARGACCRRCWRRLRRTARWAEPQRMLWARRARRRSYLWWTRHCSRRAVGRRSRRRRTSGHASAAAGRLPAARMWRVAPRKVRREACACQQPCASSVRVAS